MSELRLHEISEFERERFRQKIQDDLHVLEEIQQVLNEAPVVGAQSSAYLKQKKRTFRLKTQLESQMKDIEVDKHLKMLTVNHKDLKKLATSLKKRAVQELTSKDMKEKILFLQHKFEEEIAQEEYGVKNGFKSFPLNQRELDLLLKIQAI